VFSGASLFAIRRNAEAEAEKFCSIEAIAIGNGINCGAQTPLGMIDLSQA